MKKLVIISAFCLLMNGCAIITRGTSQVILFDSDPSGAKCSISRNDKLLHAEFITPSSLKVSKDKDKMLFICNKDGYEESRIHIASNFDEKGVESSKRTAKVMKEHDFEGLGAAIGIIDFSINVMSGTLHEYPSSVTALLRKKTNKSKPNKSKSPVAVLFK